MKRLVLGLVIGPQALTSHIPDPRNLSQQPVGLRAGAVALFLHREFGIENPWRLDPDIRPPGSYILQYRDIQFALDFPDTWGETNDLIGHFNDGIDLKLLLDFLLRRPSSTLRTMQQASRIYSPRERHYQPKTVRLGGRKELYDCRSRPHLLLVRH